MGSIRVQPETAAITGVFSVEPFITRYPSCSGQQQQRLPHHHFLVNVTLRPVESRNQKTSPCAFIELPRRVSRVGPLKLLPGAPRNSRTNNTDSNSDDGTEEPQFGPPASPSESGSQPGLPPYVPRDKQEKASEAGDPKVAAARSALERAAAYKKLRKLSPNSSTAQSEPKKSSAPPPQPEGELPRIEIIRGESFQTRLQSASPVPTNVDSPAEDTSGSKSQDGSNVDLQRLIEEKLAGESDSELGPAASSVEGKQEKDSLAAFQRAKVYKQQQAEMVAALRGQTPEESSSSGPEGARGPDPSGAAAAASDEKVMEIEIITRDGVVRRKLMNPEEQMKAFSNIKDVKRRAVSGIDFAGLGFADKKKSGRPAGLSEGFAAPPSGKLPEVEILTRDAGSPQTDSAEQASQDAEQLYKPRVSTWGVFPRPADISKAYGGGRTIRPGESLETDAERKVREARTQKLLADYRKKMGLDADPKIKAEAENAVKQGDSLMDNGRLREALVLYESAMNKMPAQSEVHGRAALQAAVCLDSLSRYDEARQVYERLLAHPNGEVRKQARRFLYGFAAMEKLKVDGGYKWDTSSYQKYFNSFAAGYNTTYKAENGEETKENLLPYALLLLCPVLLVFALAAARSG